jgi:hypothetical protein
MMLSGKIANFLRRGRDLVRGSAFDRVVEAIKKFGLFKKALIDAEVADIKESGLFDESFYLCMCTDLQPAPRDPIRHYCEHGWREGRNPSADFDTRSYLATYSDIRNAGMNPFWHFVVAGASEQRQAVPDSAMRFENDIQFGVVDTDIKLLAFYSLPDWTKLHSGRPASKGISQPLLPYEELGFYDQLDWRVLEKQAQMAKRHGLYGFCLDLGTGSNKGDAARPLPIELFLAHDNIDFRFCVQTELHSEDTLESLVASLIRAISDKRYICIQGRPVILVTVLDENQDVATALRLLRCRLAKQDVGNPFLIVRSSLADEVPVRPVRCRARSTQCSGTRGDRRLFAAG